MTATAHQPDLLGEATPPPALPLYPQFEPLENIASLGLPSEIAVQITCAWRGILSPFECDNEARLIARALARNKAVRVSAGMLVADSAFSKLPICSFEASLCEMAEDFDVLVLQLEPFSHPLIYCLGPEISARTFRDHPHLRRDLPLQFGERRIDALCIYSAAEHQHIPGLSWVEEYLAQASIFLAKHLIWCRTSVLLDLVDGRPIYSWETGGPFFADFMAETATQINPLHKTVRSGTWLGPAAKQGMNHLLLPPNGPCWCGKRASYLACCRNREMLAALNYFSRKRVA